MGVQADLREEPVGFGPGSGSAACPEDGNRWQRVASHFCLCSVLEGPAGTRLWRQLL